MQVIKLEEKQLEPGDILLCYSSATEGKAEELKNGYSHAAINTRKNGVLESSSSGVKTTDISSLLEEYGHMAVLRNSELWSTERLSKLDEFTKNQIGKIFNSIGMHKVPSRKDKQQGELMQKIEGYFDGSYKPPPYEKIPVFALNSLHRLLFT